MSAASDSTDFVGTERFAIRRRLGAGGFGVVYEAFDKERNIPVALKTLQRIDGVGIYRFKQEFRALAGVTHRNLVGLHELVSVGDSWFFTMDLVRGVDFLTHSRAGAAVSLAHTVEANTSMSLELRATDPALSNGSSNLDANRLREALGQLVAGVEALHAAGKLHRDLKPSNVLVTDEGRVVLLDFGLVAPVAHGSPLASAEISIMGTPAYMSPEQASGRPLAASSDWYSVGVMLYEVLAGRLPFEGSVLSMLTAKQERDPPSLDAGALMPRDLATLCMELLNRDAAKRPTGEQLLRRLGAPEKPASTVVSDAEREAASRDASFVGRAAHLARIETAFTGIRAGRAATVFVHGRSGMGKSALVRHFLDRVASREGAVVLEGRCYERESMPYKALDSLVDALTRYLMHLATHEAAALMPREVWALARLFPVLNRVEAVASAPRREFETNDRQEVKRRGTSALRELFARLADRHPLVLAVDDLQWGDLDSASLFEELVRQPDAPALMLLASYREEDAETSPLLRALRTQLAAGRTQPVDVAIEPLAIADARALALQLIGRADDNAVQRAEAIARECGGSPFFLQELVHSAAKNTGATVGESLPGGNGPSGSLKLQDVLLLRLDALPAPARRMLEVIAVAGQPILEPLAGEAADLGEEAVAAVSVLRAARLIRTLGSGERDEVETYHDRIRETVVANLSPSALAEYHKRLAAALVKHPGADPEALSTHYRGAGEREAAGRFAAIAAKRAAEALAFGRAVQLYRFALEVCTDAFAERSLRVALADALALAGNGSLAAHEYLTAATGADAALSLELRRRAAEQFLLCGCVDDGLEAIGALLHEVGLSMPKSPWQVIVTLAYHRARLQLRGLAFRERDVALLSARDTARMDIYWSVARGLAMIDTVRGADFQTRNLLLSLRAGDPRRIARALAYEAAFVGTDGMRSAPRARRLVEASRQLADRIGGPDVTGVATITAGSTAFLLGDFRQARTLCDDGEKVLRDGCTGFLWEVASAQAFGRWASFYLGDVNDLVSRVPGIIRDATERGDLYTATTLRIGRTNVIWLAADDPARAEREIDEAMSTWSQRGFHLQHYFEELARANLALYRADGWKAWMRIQTQWTSIARSLLLRVQLCGVEMLHVRARCALAVVAGGSGANDDTMLASAERDARAIEKEKLGWGNGLALLVRAGIAHARGDDTAAAPMFASAATQLDAAGMALYAACARRRHGVLIGGDAGRALVAQVDQWMSAQQIRSPARFTAMLAPGEPGRARLPG